MADKCLVNIERKRKKKKFNIEMHYDHLRIEDMHLENYQVALEDKHLLNGPTIIAMQQNQTFLSHVHTFVT